MKLFISIVVLGLTAVFVTNMVIDVAGVNTFRQVTELSRRQAPDELLVWENLFDQRAWTKAKLERGCPEILVLGSSTVGQLDQTMFPGHRLLNGWLTAPTVEDFEALTAVMSESSCHPATIIVGVDPWLLNAAFKDQRWQSLFDDFLAYHRNTGKLRAFGLRTVRAWSLFKERLNFTTTRLTVEHVLRRFRGEPEASAPHLVSTTGEAYCATISSAQYIRANDGHFISCPEFVPTQQEVEDIARSYVLNNGHEVHRWKEVDPHRRARFEIVTRRWSDLGSHVVFVTPPYHPLAYQALRADPLIAANLDALDRVLSGSGFPYVNLRDPATPGCKASEFEDSHHGARSCVLKVAARLVPRLP